MCKTKIILEVVLEAVVKQEYFAVDFVEKVVVLLIGTVIKEKDLLRWLLVVENKRITERVDTHFN